MPASELQRRTVFTLGFAGVIVIILIIIPLAEGFIRDYILANFNLAVTPEGRTVATDGRPPGMMTETTISLVVTLLRILKIILWMTLIFTLVRFIMYLIFGSAFRTAAQSEISSLIRTVLSIIIYIVAFFIIFQSQYPSVQLAPLFTGSAILGIVVGLALQDTLGNLFAGIAMQADAPFGVGDVISISNRGTGVVESVSWRGVKIRTFQNKLLVISNAVLGKETIEVAPNDNLNARIVYFSTLYTASPAKTAQVVREAARQVENVSQKIRPIVRIKNLGESGMEWEVKYWIEDYTKFNDTDAMLRQRIWYVFQRENIDFAYPTRTIHMEPRPVETPVDELVDSISECLSKVPIFAPLSEEETDRLAEASTARVFAPGEAIVRMGQEGRSMFVITRGQVNIQVPENGIPKTINTLRENEFFGEMSLLTGQPRSANVVAAEETEVLQIRKDAVKPIFEGNPELVRAIGEIVEERRELLNVQAIREIEKSRDTDRGMLGSIKKFFGMS